MRRLASAFALALFASYVGCGSDGGSTPLAGDGGVDVSAGDDVGVATDGARGGDGDAPGYDAGPPPSCPAPPAGASTAALDAHAAVEAARVGAGSPCATMVTELNLSAAKHCAYYAANTKQPTCIANPHVEVSSCASFFAAAYDQRMKAAGYAGSPSSEDMHFLGAGKAAVQGWLDTIYHRYPILDPWTRDFGYGNATGCDTMDFGAGAATPSSTVAVYPYDGQTGVPTSFGGAETPAPPMPPGGWPAGYPISVFYKGTLAKWTVTQDGATTALPTQSPAKLGYQGNATFFYTDKPLSPKTKYLVHVEGNNGAAFSRDWSFTTQ